MKQIALGENSGGSKLRLNSICLPDPQTVACYSFTETVAVTELHRKQQKDADFQHLCGSDARRSGSSYCAHLTFKGNSRETVSKSHVPCDSLSCMFFSWFRTLLHLQCRRWNVPEISTYICEGRRGIKVSLLSCKSTKKHIETWRTRTSVQLWRWNSPHG